MKYSYSRYIACAGRRSAWPGRALLAALLALTLLAFGTATAPGHARAANGTDQINFISPIYAGQNNGIAEGPVGTVVTIQGTGWAAGGGPVSVYLVDSQYDTAGQPGSACVTGSQNVSIPGLDAQQVDSNGDFTASFTWPAAANAVGHSYWACGGQVAATFPGTGEFTVLGANPPSLSIGNTTTVPVKGSVTVKGQNWLPGNQSITVLLVPCLNCDGQPLATQNVNAASDGTFSVNLTLPDQVAAGTTLYVIASNQATSPSVSPGLVVNSQGSAPSFTVVDQPTATPTPSPTATNTPAPTGTPASNTGGNRSNSSSNGLLIVLLSALAVVLLLAAVVAVLLFVRSRNPDSGGPPSGGSGGYPSQGGGYGGQYAAPRRRTGGSGPTSDYTNLDYYNEPPRPPARGGGWGGQGWQSGQPGQLPDDSASGDQPTISSPPPWG